MSTETKESPACTGTASKPCGCGASACRTDDRGERGGSRTRTGVWAVLAAAVACLVCLGPGAAVALGAAGVVAFTPAGIGGALLAAAVALVAWRVIQRSRRAS
jgi:hypothetical protein